MSDTTIGFRLAVSGDAQVVAAFGKTVAAQDDVAAASARLTGRAETAAEAMKRLGVDTAQTAAGMSTQATRFLDDLERQAAAIGKTRTELLGMQAAQLGVSNQAAPFLQRLREAEVGLGKAGSTAVATSRALGLLTPQLGDLVSQISAGGAPITAFVQQGMQLRDVFANDATALQGLKQLITPTVAGVGLLAGVALATAVAYNQGAAEADGYRRAVVMSGNAAGVTIGQLKELAKEQADQVGTQHAAAEALAAITTTGAVSAENLATVSVAAAKAQRELGIAVGESARNFTELGRDPLQASMRLNSANHYLTLGTYEQIRALTEQGRLDEAASVAQQAYAQALISRADTIKGGLGYVERAARGVGDAFKWMWDRALDIGRETTLEDRLAKAQARLGQMRSNGGGAWAYNGGDYKEGLVSAEESIRTLNRTLLLRTETASAAAAEAAAVEAKSKWDSDSLQYLTRQEQKQRALTQLRNEALAAGQLDSDRYREGVRAIEQQYDTGVNIIQLHNTEAVQLERLQRSHDAINSQRTLGYISEREAIEQNTALDLRAIDARRTALQGELAIVSARRDSEGQVAQLRGQLAVLDVQRIDAQLRGERELDAERKRRLFAELEAKQALRDEDDAQRHAVFEKEMAARAQMERSLYQQNLELDQQLELNRAGLSLLGATNEQRDITLEKLRIEFQLRQRIAEIDAMSGAFIDDDWKERQREMARQQAVKAGAAAEGRIFLTEWQKFTDQVNQSMADAIMNGVKDGSELGRNYLKSFAFRFIVQPELSAGISSAANAVGIGGGGGSGGASALGTVSNGVSLYRAGTGLAGTASSAVSAYGSLTGSASVGAYGAGMGMTSAEAAAAAEAYSAAGMAEIGSSVAAGSSAGSALAALGPYAAAAIAIYAIAKSLDDSGTPHMMGSAMADAATSRITTQSDHPSEQFGQFTLGTAKEVSALLNGIGVIGGGGSYAVNTMFADDSSDDGAWGALSITRNGQKALDWEDTRTSRWAPREFGDGTSGQQQYLAEVAKATRTVLDDMDLPSWADSLLTSIGNAPSLQDLAAVADEIVRVQNVLTSLGGTVSAFADLTGNEATNLLKAFGGANTLAAGMSSYIDAIYTDSDKLALQQQQLSEAFTALGKTMPSTTAELRAMIEAQGVATQADAQMLAGLVRLAPAFAAVQKQVDQQAKAAQEKVSTARSTLVDAYKREADALQTAADGHRTFADALREFSSGMVTSNLSPLSPVEQYRQAQLQFEQTNALALANDPAARERWQQVAQQFLELSQTVNASSAGYLRDYERVQAAAADTAIHAQASADVAQLQLDAAQSQVDLLGGIDASAASIADGMIGLRDAVSEALKAGAKVADLGPLPSFDVGTNYVPRDMIARVHRGERIVPAADNAALMSALRSPGADAAGLERLLRSMLTELQNLRLQNNDGHAANVAATERTAHKVAAGVADGVSRGAHAAALKNRAEVK
jgi:phage-related minor tail protein